VVASSIWLAATRPFASRVSVSVGQGRRVEQTSPVFEEEQESPVMEE
jgi:hypothetical protein